MQETVEFERVDRVLEELSYPVMRTDAAAELQAVTLRVGDREDDLGRLVSETNSDSFDSPEAIVEELRTLLTADEDE